MKILDRIDKGLLLPTQEQLKSKYWFDQDTEELYEKNLIHQPEDWYYRTKVVEYNLNSENYRTKEFNDINWSKSIVVFGCSYIFGIGSAEDETIPSYLEKITGMPVVNLGVPGSSPTFTLHNSIILNETYPTPKAIVVGWSSPYRYPYYTDNKVIHCGHWNRNEQKMSDVWCHNQNNPLVNLKLTSKIFKEIWSTKTKYYEFSMFHQSSKLLKCDFIQKLDNGRDVQKQPDGAYVGHPGKETNLSVAKKIAKSLEL